MASVHIWHMEGVPFSADFLSSCVNAVAEMMLFESRGVIAFWRAHPQYSLNAAVIDIEIDVLPDPEGVRLANAAALALRLRDMSNTYLSEVGHEPASTVWVKFLAGGTFID